MLNQTIITLKPTVKVKESPQITLKLEVKVNESPQNLVLVISGTLEYAKIVNPAWEIPHGNVLLLVELKSCILLLTLDDMDDMDDNREESLGAAVPSFP